jgi:ComF family protein
MRSLLQKLFQFFLPSQCACCERFLGEAEQGLCSDCLSRVRWIEPPFCTVCGVPFISPEAGLHPCGTCRSRPRHFTTARALGYYVGPLQEIIHRWKYQGRLSLTPLLGRWMSEGLSRFWEPDSLELLIPVPLHTERLRDRGFNQSLLLVRAVSRHTGIPFARALLQKRRATVPQIHLSGRERERAVKGTYEVVRKDRLKGGSILLVDDVYTTGATVNECARVLVKAGANRVEVLTLAHAIRKT